MAIEVDIGRGLVLVTPVLVASGPFGYGVEAADAVDLPRLGAIVTRSTTLRARSGHARPTNRRRSRRVLLGHGPPEPGDRDRPRALRARLGPLADAGDRDLAGESAGDLASLARQLEGVPGIAGIELNLSCGNASRGGVAFALDPDSAASAVSAVRRATDLPLIAKLSAAAGDVRAVARAVEEAGADAISAINTLPGLAVRADRGAPRSARLRRVSGPALKPIALRVVFEVAQIVDVPVIGIGGVATLDDVLDLLAVGASAVGVGSPRSPTRCSPCGWRTSWPMRAARAVWPRRRSRRHRAAGAGGAAVHARAEYAR